MRTSDIASETATVTYADGAVTPDVLAKAATDAGYPAEIAGRAASEDRDARKEEERGALQERAAAIAVRVQAVRDTGADGHAIHNRRLRDVARDVRLIGKI